MPCHVNFATQTTPGSLKRGGEISKTNVRFTVTRLAMQTPRKRGEERRGEKGNRKSWKNSAAHKRLLLAILPSPANLRPFIRPSIPFINPFIQDPASSIPSSPGIPLIASSSHLMQPASQPASQPTGLRNSYRGNCDRAVLSANTSIGLIKATTEKCHPRLYI